MDLVKPPVAPPKVQTTELDKAKKEVNDLKKELDDKKKQLQEVMQKNKIFDEQINKLQKQQKEKDEQINKLQKQQKEKQDQINKLQKQQKEKQDQINELQKKEKEASVKNVPKNIEVIDSKTMKQYETVEELGIGSTGRVVKVAMKQYYALKILISDFMNAENMRHLLNEYEIMNLLNHPNILKAFGIFLSDEKNPPAILLEFCPTNLFKVIKNKQLSNVEIANTIYQIVEGMKYIHFRKIIHRDLKPTNILIAADGTIKICDFGIAKIMTTEQFSMTIGVGTNKFMAPEIINDEENYNEKVDVYSFGVLVYFVLSGGLLPKIKTAEILAGKKAELPSSFTDFAKSIINACWSFNPKDRPSFDEICRRIKEQDSNLVKLTTNEMKEVKNFIKNHQKRIPNY